MNRIIKLIIFSSLIIGNFFDMEILQAQNMPSIEMAEQLLSIAKKNLKENKLDSVYLKSNRLLQIAKAENLSGFKAKSHFLLGKYFSYSGNADSAMYHLNGAETIFIISKDTTQLGITFLIKSVVFKSIGKRDSMLNYQLKANQLLSNPLDTLWYSISNNFLGNSYLQNGNYILALKHFQKSLDASKLLNRTIDIGANYNSMGVIYRKINDKQNEEKAYLQAIKILLNEKPTIYLGEAYNNLAEIYFDNGEVEKAFETIEDARGVFEDIGYNIGLSGYYSVIGYYYSTLPVPDNAKVIENFKKSISIAEKYGDMRQYADGTSYLGTAFMEIGQLQKAREILEKGLDIAEENGFAPEYVKISEILAKVYSKSNQPSRAYQLLVKHMALKDSLSGEEKIKEFTQLDLKYKFRQQQISDSLENVQKKLESDNLHRKELQDQQNSKNIIIYFSILVVIIAIFILINNIKKKKQVEILNRKNKKINQQKSEIEAYAKKINEAYLKLQELDEYKQAMTNMLIHDLKNPLNLLVNLDGIEGENEKDLVINRAGNQMLNLVMNLLDISKAEDNRMELHKLEENLTKVFESAVKEVEFLSNQKNVKIIVNAVHNYSIHADREVLTRVFVNFLTNAIKYSPVNGEVIYNAELTAKNHLRLTIKDNGKGIHKKFHEIIFEKFKQVEEVNSGVVKSTGLGLAFCKLAAESHGWRIGVDSEPGKGAEFWIEINEFKNQSDTLKSRSKQMA